MARNHKSNIKIKRKIAEEVLCLIEGKYSGESWEDALLILCRYILALKNKDMTIRVLHCLVLESIRNDEPWMLNELLSDKENFCALEYYKLTKFLERTLELVNVRKKKKQQRRRISSNCVKKTLCLCCHDYVLDRDVIYRFPENNTKEHLWTRIKSAMMQKEREKREFLLTQMLQQYFDNYGISRTFIKVWVFLEASHIHIDLYQLSDRDDLEFVLLPDNIKQTIHILSTRSSNHDSLIDDLMLLLLEKRKHGLAFYIGAKTSVSMKRLFYTFWNVLSFDSPTEDDLRFLIRTHESVKGDLA